MDKVIFLDIDGVLNNHAWLARRKYAIGRLHKAIETLDPANVAVLNAIVERSGARVIVHSAWRYNLDVRELRLVLDGAGFAGTIAGAIPRYGDDEDGGIIIADDIGMMLHRWLRYRPRITGCVILEDSTIMGPMAEYQVRTSSAAGGLRPEHVEQALAILAKEATW